MQKKQREALREAQRLGVEDIRFVAHARHDQLIGTWKGRTFSVTISRGVKAADRNATRDYMRRQIRQWQREAPRMSTAALRRCP